MILSLSSLFSTLSPTIINRSENRTLIIFPALCIPFLWKLWPETGGKLQKWLRLLPFLFRFGVC